MAVEKRNPLPKPAPKRIGVLVLGMHRSGTSALTRVLNLLGCDLPKTLMESREFNETGHWESWPIACFNDDLLKSAGSNWHDWLEFNPGWHASPKAAEYKEKALTLLENELGRSSLFVLKDPRICRFAPFWIDVLEAAGIQPAVVTHVRNPLEVASSLSRRDGFDPALSHLLWLRHVLEAEAGSRGRYRFHSSYDGLLTGWPRLVSDMQGALNVSWPRLSPMTSSEIENFLRENLRHHSETRDKVLGNPMLSSWLRDSFAIFNRWAEEGESEADYPALDRIRTELNDAAPAFAQLILSAHQRAEDLKALAAEHAAMIEASSTLENELKTVRAQLEESRGALLEAQAALDGVSGELSQTQSALAQRSAEADEVTAQLRQADQRNAEQAAELEAQRNTANAEIEKLRHEKGVAESRLTERFSELAALTRMLRNMETEVETSSRQAKEREKAARQSEERANWLREVSEVILNGSAPDLGKRSLKGRLSVLLRAPSWKKQKARLKESGIFDPDAYLAANPDVAEAGFDPLRHYIIHGISEGRKLQ